MAETFIDQAESLLEWIESARRQTQGNRSESLLADLDISGFALAIVLLQGRLIPQARSRLAGPPVIAFWGGTNTGKSTLINSLVGKIASPAGGTAGFTRRLIGAGSSEDWRHLFVNRRDWRLVSYDEIAKTAPEERVVHLRTAAEGFRPASLNAPVLLLDTPDLDSANPHCRLQAGFALDLADVAVWVTTGQKYKDQAGIDFLDEAMALISCRFDLFNQSLPRFGDAIEDLRREYDRRWPLNERSFLAIPESPAEGEGFLPAEILKPLAERLSETSRGIRALRERSGLHALRQTGTRLLQSAATLRSRRQEIKDLGRQVRQRLDEGLFQPLHLLPGHEVPFELQAALVRVLGPRLQTRVGELLNRATETASDLLSGFRNRLLGAPSGAPTDPIGERDRADLETARLVIEKTRQGVLAWLRQKSRDKRNDCHRRLHEAVRHTPLPEAAALTEQLERHLQQRNRELLLPLIERFENDLERFCEENPHMIQALQVVVPGVSTAASIAAAALTIKTLTVLPGVSEYLLAGVAVPIYRRLEGHLPAPLLQVCTTLSRSPFIQKAREEFVQARRTIFHEAGEWLSRPIAHLLELPELPGIDLQSRLKSLEDEWTRLCRECR